MKYKLSKQRKEPIPHYREIKVGGEEINSKKLKELIKNAGYTQVRLAEELDISPNSLSSKITGKSEFTLREARNVCECLDIADLSKRAELFLT